MVIDGTDPFAAKPDARLIKLLFRARRFNATLSDSEGIPFAVLVQWEGVSRSYFTRLVRLSYLAPDITQAILDGRHQRDLTAEKLPRALPSAACLARSADRARLRLSPMRIQRSASR
jgi:site-specific DNA recombinase